jgi:hypothetical protein
MMSAFMRATSPHTPGSPQPLSVVIPVPSGKEYSIFDTYVWSIRTQHVRQALGERSLGASALTSLLALDTTDMVHMGEDAKEREQEHASRGPSRGARHGS